MAAGLIAGAALVDYGTSRGDLLLMGSLTGLGLVGVQLLVLARPGFRARPEPARRGVGSYCTLGAGLRAGRWTW
jgi:hypothetical protein